MCCLSRLLINRAVLFCACALLSCASALASFQVLPSSLLYQRFGKPMSADGNVILVHVTISDTSYPARWRSTGTQLLSLPAGGRNWESLYGLTADGSTVIGSGVENSAVYDGWMETNGLVTVVPSGSYASAGIVAISPTGSYFIVRYLDDAGVATFSRWYPKTGFIVGMGTVPAGASVTDISEDGNVRVGYFRNPYNSAQLLPAFWKGFDGAFVGSAFMNQPGNSTAEETNRDGSVIVGETTTGATIPGYGAATKVFVWRPAVNQDEFHTPPGFITTDSGFVSPDGNLVQLVGYLANYESKVVMYDCTSAATKAKGYQEISAWLVSEGYLAAADVLERSDFVIYTMSDDRRVVARLQGFDRFLHHGSHAAQGHSGPGIAEVYRRQAPAQCGHFCRQ